MRKFFYLILLSLVSLPILSFARPDSWPQEGDDVKCIPGSIKGIVLDEDGFPLEKVQLGLRTSGQVLDETLSDQKGQFAFPKVDAGRYEIQAELPGHERISKEFLVSEDMCTVLEMVMPLGLPKSNPVVEDLDFQLSSPNLYLIEHPTQQKAPAW